MKFLGLLITLATVSSAGPLARRQFSATAYDDLSISGGVAGNAAQEALEALGGMPDDFSALSEEDIDFYGSVNSICNDAETEAFNVAIDEADGEEAEALEVSPSFPLACPNSPSLHLPDRPRANH